MLFRTLKDAIVMHLAEPTSRQRRQDEGTLRKSRALRRSPTSRSTPVALALVPSSRRSGAVVERCSVRKPARLLVPHADQGASRRIAHCPVRQDRGRRVGDLPTSATSPRTVRKAFSAQGARRPRHAQAPRWSSCSATPQGERVEVVPQLPGSRRAFRRSTSAPTTLSPPAWPDLGRTRARWMPSPSA